MSRSACRKGTYHEPTFDFDVVGPDEQRIPVESHLRLDIGTGNADLAVAPQDLPWYAPLFAAVAHSPRVADTLLGLSALVVLYAFTFLPISSPASPRASS